MCIAQFDDQLLESGTAHRRALLRCCAFGGLTLIFATPLLCRMFFIVATFVQVGQQETSSRCNQPELQNRLYSLKSCLPGIRTKIANTQECYGGGRYKNH